MSVPATPEAAPVAAPEPPVDCGVKGMMDLGIHLDKPRCECLNEANDHPWAHAMTPGGGFLESDCDEQIILCLAYNQNVKIHSLKIRAPPGQGPKNLRIFANLPNNLDFDHAESMVATQDITLTPEQLDGKPIALKFVKYQNVQSIQFFFQDNQTGEETTQIDYFAVIGTPLNTTDMGDFKRVAGKKGEGH